MFDSSLPATDRAEAAQSRGPASNAGFLDPSRWQRLAEAVETDDYAEQWLALQCEFLDEVAGAVVVLGKPGRAMQPVAVWPAGRAPSSALQAIGEAAVSEARGIIKRATESADQASWLVAYPIVVEGEVYGVVALQIRRASQAALAPAMRQLQWGCAWLEAFVRRKNLPSSARLASVLQTMAVALDHPRFQGAATAVATELANMLHCDRVSVGIRNRRNMRVLALSHSAEFGKKSNLVRLLGTAMEEAADQQAILAYPSPDPHSHLVLHAHEALAKQHGAGYICTIPMVEAGELIGAITLERSGAAFPRHEIEQLEHIATLLGPILHAKWLEDRWLIAKVWRSGSDAVHKLVGPRHVGFKLTAAGLALAIAVLTSVDAEYRVTSDATLEGTVQRSVTAPIAGYISESHARAGDIVESGQLLATLDERDFQLERVRWISEKEKFLREYSRALAEGDRGRVSVLAAQVDQADAQLSLLEEELAKTRIVAPFAGVIVSGDLSQSLSAPVERGEVLFEVAPLDSYRVILRVDERDISMLEVGQRGQLALTGLPGQPLALQVEKITPVSVAREGRNYFEVEAELLDAHELLRPGMEGVGKVAIGERRLGWIYTHKLVDWFRTFLWTVLP